MSRRATGARLACSASAVLTLLVLARALSAGAFALGAGATAAYVTKPPAIPTPWTRSVSTVAPLPEYPRPLLQRPRWLSLNGPWEYQQAQPSDTPPFGKGLAETILVPFPVQSPLSGIERGDSSGWYRRTFTVPPQWGQQHVLLNFGAVSWAASVYVNGRLAGTHQGDYDAFSFDITPLLSRTGTNELIVGFNDPIGRAGEPIGKQVAGSPHSIYHTASSGIWQTVWLEPVATDHLTSLDLTPDVPGGRLTVSAATAGSPGGRVIAEALAGKQVVAVAGGEPGRPFALRIPHARLWSPWDPYLYGLRVRLVSGAVVLDRAQSYFGMRSISVGRAGGMSRLLLNGRFVFQTGALDQGYWPDGLYTAPSDAALQFDIIAAKNLGYDMLRKHVKVEPDRWYYWADKLGILVWQDMPSMRLTSGPTPSVASEAEFRRELSAVVSQHLSHPSIVTWVPFNEGWGQFDLPGITSEIRSLDRSRPIDADSGSANCCNAAEPPSSDIRDTHLYFGPFAVAADRRASVIGEYGGVLPFPPVADRWPGVVTSIGMPVLAWRVPPVAEFLRQQYAELEQHMRIGGLSAAVFTELAGYEQELGILSYDRRVYTIPPELLRQLNESLIAASMQSSDLRPQPAAVPPGTTGLWRFDEGRGMRVADDSGNRHPLSLRGGAGWTAGVRGGALAITGLGQSAVATGRVIDTGGSFTVSAWLSSRAAGQSGSAVSEPGPRGSSFSLGIQAGVSGPRAWWTFMVPAGASCSSAECGLRANIEFDDGRFTPSIGSWHQVVGVYDQGTHTLTLYADGIPQSVEHVPGVPPARGPLTVGAGLDDYRPTDTFIGAIDQLRTYGRALTPGEVWQLFAAERPAARGARRG